MAGKSTKSNIPGDDDDDDIMWSPPLKERSLSDSSINSISWMGGEAKERSISECKPVRQRSNSTNKEMWVPTLFRNQFVKAKTPLAAAADKPTSPEPIKPPRPKRMSSFKRKDKDENGSASKEKGDLAKSKNGIPNAEKDPVKPPRRKLPNPPTPVKPKNLKPLKTKDGTPKTSSDEGNRDIISKPVITSSPYQDMTIEDVDSAAGHRIISVYDDSSDGVRKVESFYDYLYSKEEIGSAAEGESSDKRELIDDNVYDDVPLESSSGSLNTLGTSRRLDSDSIIYDEVIVNKEYYLMPVEQSDEFSDSDPWGSDFEEEEIFDNVDYGRDDDDDDDDIEEEEQDDDDDEEEDDGSGSGITAPDVTPIVQRRRPFKFLMDSATNNSPNYKKVSMPGLSHGLKGLPGHIKGCFGMAKTASLPYLAKPNKGESRLIADTEEPDYVDPNIADTENYSQPVMPPITPGLSIDQVKRYQIVKFILESEADYMKLMDLLIKKYELPIRERDLLEPSKIDLIFLPIHKVLDCHVMFNIALSGRMAEWCPDEKIGDILYALFSKSMVLEAYSAYVNNFAKAMDTIKSACRTHLAFSQLLKARRQSYRERVTLHSLMLKPIKRFPQLIDLIQELLVVTPVIHPDRIPLQMALTQLESLADNLNERKRESELRSKVKQLDVATAHLSKPLSSGNRYFIRQDDFVQCVIEGDTIIHTKRRRLIMLSDMLLCVSLIKGKKDRMANLITDVRAKYKLKWNVPLTDVEVIEYGPGVHIYASPNRTTITQAKEGQYRGCQEHFEDLQHDMTIIGQIAGLVATLRRSYQILDNDKVQKWHKAVQRTIEEESRLANIYWLELSLPAKSGRVNYIFSTENPGVKAEWLTALNTAMLRLAPENNPGWFLPEDDGTGGVAVQRRNMPLLKDNTDLFLLNPNARVMGIVSCPDSSDPLPGIHDNYDNLWLLCGGGESTGLVSVVRVSSASSPQIIESFLVCDSHILCGEYVKRTCHETEKFKGPLSGKFGFPFPTVWLGTQSGKIYIYNGVDSERRYVMSVKLPDAVLTIRETKGKIFAGLADGSVVVFKPNEEGVWEFTQPKAIGISKISVMSIAATSDSLWCASGNKIHVIDLERETVRHVIEVDSNPKTTVRHLVCYGIGVWVSLWKLPTIKLFHSETLQHVQDINIAYAVNTMQRDVDSQLEKTKLDKLYVSCMVAEEGLLWVGTSVGVILIFPLPRLEGIPLVSGRACVSFHAYQGRVRALYPLRNNPDMGVEIGRSRGKRPGYQLFREHETRDACVQTDVGISGVYSYAANGPVAARKDSKPGAELSTITNSDGGQLDEDEDIDAVHSDDEFSFVDDNHKATPSKTYRKKLDFSDKPEGLEVSVEMASGGPDKVVTVDEIEPTDFAKMMEEFKGFGSSVSPPSLPEPPNISAVLVTGSISKELDKAGKTGLPNGTSETGSKINGSAETGRESGATGNGLPILNGDSASSSNGKASDFRGRVQSSGQYVELSEAQEGAKKAGEMLDAKTKENIENTKQTGSRFPGSEAAGSSSSPKPEVPLVSAPEYMTVLNLSDGKQMLESDSDAEDTIPSKHDSYSVFSSENDPKPAAKKLENLKPKLPYPVLLVSAGEGHLDLRRKKADEKNTDPRLMIWQIN